jgi:hypothetical protein
MLELGPKIYEKEIHPLFVSSPALLQTRHKSTFGNQRLSSGFFAYFKKISLLDLFPDFIQD